MAADTIFDVPDAPGGYDLTGKKIMVHDLTQPEATSTKMVAVSSLSTSQNNITKVLKVTLADLGMTTANTDAEIKAALAAYIEGKVIPDNEIWYYQIDGFPDDSGGGGGGTTNYKVFTALLSQEYGTNNLIVSVIENTLDFTPVITRTAVGSFGSMTFDEHSVDFSKCFCLISLNLNESGINRQIFAGFSSEDNYFAIKTYLDAVLSDGVLADIDGFRKTYLELRIYN